jgi:hypothetical protein
MRNERGHDYRAILPGNQVVFREAPVRLQDRRYLLGVAENLSLGGLFIATRHPFPVGSFVCLDLYPGGDGDGAPFSARAVVRWRRLWREPRGMGLQFLEFLNLAERPLSGLLDRTLTSPQDWRPSRGPAPSSPGAARIAYT